MKRFYTTILFLFFLISVQGQDPNFSQFFASPLTLNPAFTGKFNGQLRVAGNYRNQWPSINNAFVTYTASADMGIMKNRISENDQFGVGVMAFSDKSGNGVLQHNYVALSAAYHKGLDEDGAHQLGVGFQGTYVNKRLGVGSLLFEDMLRSDGFTGLSTEDFKNFRLNQSYFDLNAGVLYNGTTNGDNNIYAGVSMYHVNRHEETFSDTGRYYLAPRITLHGGGRFPIGEFNAFHFSANHSRQAGATNTMLGGAYELNLNANSDSPTSLYIGTWYRLNDAVIPYIGLEFGDLHLGATYDVNISKLKPASNLRGGAEISLIYIKHAADRSLDKLNCPKF
jgi:type IX secretion system PorP/SprF family membrane protein